MHSNNPYDAPASLLPKLLSDRETLKQSRVINRAYVKRWALDYAKTNKAHPFTRVSDEFLNAVEASTKAFIRDRINRAPSRGVTLK